MRNPIPRKERKSFEPFLYPIIEKRALSRNFPIRERAFLDVYLSRKSSRTINRLPNDLLSELLYYSARTQYVYEDEDGDLISKRAAPSAGARHPIDLLVSPTPEDGVRYLSYYNPLDHSLNKLDIENEMLQSFFKEVNDNVVLKEAALIWFVANAKKTSSKYDNSESLYWRDAGALLYCIQIASTYLELSSCPLGSLAAASFKYLFNSDDVISAGGILIGT